MWMQLHLYRVSPFEMRALDGTPGQDELVLGQAAGMYHERPVVAALRRHFARAWFRRMPPGSPGKIALSVTTTEWGISTMVRFLVLYHKPNDTEAFERLYREVHIPLTKKLAGLRRYTLSRNPGPVRGGEPYYLVAELDWDDMAALQRAFQSPEGQATVADAANLAKLSPGVHMMTYELEEVC